MHDDFLEKQSGLEHALVPDEEQSERSEEERQMLAMQLAERTLQQNPLFGQMEAMFQGWEAMLESYRQEEMDEESSQDERERR